jgi:hypothetical protein
MRLELSQFVRPSGKLLLLTALAVVGTSPVFAQALVPGTGQHITKVGDDFEDPAWLYVPQSPKSSENIDKQLRMPTGASKNGRWFESALRGQPDVVKRVETPEGGLPGSTGALLLRSLQTGVPYNPSGVMQQDDLILNIRQPMGGYVPVSWSPSIVVRVYLPPFEQWENRSGSSFALRAGLRGIASSGKKAGQMDDYWPGIFIIFNSETDQRGKKDSAALLIRAGEIGNDIRGPEILEPGWWTLGMSFTPDGRVHYYAHAGVEDLTAKDHLASHRPYGFQCTQFDTFFFNVVNRDDGRSWSTSWIIDDPALYAARMPVTAQRPATPAPQRRPGQR